MTLFPDALLADLRRLPGASYTFARQVAEEDGAGVRARMESIASRVGLPVQDRWADLLGSLDNRRFFQGYAEAALVGLLSAGGWSLPDLAWPGPGLLLQAPDGREFHALVLAFIRQVRPGADRASIQRLGVALGRVGARSRIGLVIHRWLPHDFDPEPVRQAVELWLREVERGGWTGRYAAYEDDHISIEFALTGEQAKAGQSVLAFALGPYQAHRVLEAVGSRVVSELDRLRALGCSSPILVACVTDQPWCLPRGYLRELMYGKPTWQTTAGDPPSLCSAFAPSEAPSLYRDPLYFNVSATLFLERPVNAPAETVGSAYLNPWAANQLEPRDMPCPTLGVRGYDKDMAIMTWFNERARAS